MKKIFSLFLVLFAFCTIAFISSSDNTIVSSRVEAAEYTQVQAAHILVSTEKEANDIRNEIMQNATTRAEIFSNFRNAAKKYSKCPSGSNGGILGWFGKGEMVPAFEKAAFTLPNGQVSEPVKTQFGWHLIYVIGKK
jgi:parvulin-like peptidyl-prolyl isomerase